MRGSFITQLVRPTAVVAVWLASNLHTGAAVDLVVCAVCIKPTKPGGAKNVQIWDVLNKLQ